MRRICEPSWSRLPLRVLLVLVATAQVPAQAAEVLTVANASRNLGWEAFEVEGAETPGALSQTIHGLVKFASWGTVPDYYPDLTGKPIVRITLDGTYNKNSGDGFYDPSKLRVTEFRSVKERDDAVANLRAARRVRVDADLLKHDSRDCNYWRSYSRFSVPSEQHRNFAVCDVPQRAVEVDFGSGWIPLAQAPRVAERDPKPARDSARASDAQLKALPSGNGAGTSAPTSTGSNPAR